MVVHAAVDTRCIVSCRPELFGNVFSVSNRCTERNGRHVMAELPVMIDGTAGNNRLIHNLRDLTGDELAVLLPQTGQIRAARRGKDAGRGEILAGDQLRHGRADDH